MVSDKLTKSLIYLASNSHLIDHKFTKFCSNLYDEEHKLISFEGLQVGEKIDFKFFKTVDNKF
jgi:hypothetical protein